MADSDPKLATRKMSPLLRRSDRVALSVPIQVQGTDAEGKPFDERTQTLVISRYGALIILPRPLAPGQQLSVRCLGTDRVSPAVVVEQVEGQHKGTLYGVELLSPDANVWEIHFPPITESEMAAGRMLLECSRCNASELVYLNLGEIEIFQKNKCVSRICEPCNAVTVWNQAALKKLQVEPPQVSVDPMSGEIAPPQVAHTEDERNDPRIALSIDGCVRTPQYGEDIVQTENVSESGARFKSRFHYAGGTNVGVAIPYIPGGANVFVQARITWAHSTQDEGVTMYGLSYSHSARRARRLKPRNKITIGFIGSGVRSLGIILDLSMRGALVKCTEEFKPGDVVKMGIEMAHETIRIAATARRNIPGVGTGFEFTQMGRNDRSLLRRLIMRIEKSLAT
ncbi:MAG TPA: PilZ domain-containing protein [Terriglobia bacterium]|nr:PilZ domain-containing protein [Terriglobia bacterium]